MNPKIAFFFALVLSGYFIPLSAQAFWTSTSVDRANIASTAPFLRIVSTRYDPTNHPMVQFSIFVLPKDNGGAELLSGVITVNDGQESKRYLTTAVRAEDPPEGAVPAAVPKSWAGKYKVFHFYIAASLLKNSGFSVNYTPDLKWGTAGGSYVFNLGDFANDSTNTQPALISDAATNTNLVTQISKVLVECQRIKPGMTRAELLKVFTTEGGLSNPAHQTFVFRGCPYVKVDVDFTSSDPKLEMDEKRPTDIISKISKPYLNWSIND